MTPQELRAVFETTFRVFSARYEALVASDEASKKNPHALGYPESIAEQVSGALEAIELFKAIDNSSAAPYTAFYARTVEIAQVAAHALALFEQSVHRCALTGETYTATGGTPARRHAFEILEQFEGLHKMVHETPVLKQLFGTEESDHQFSVEQFKTNMLLILDAFPNRVTRACLPIRPKPTQTAQHSDDSLATVALIMSPAFMRALDMVHLERELIKELGKISLAALALWRAQGDQQACNDFLQKQFLPSGYEVGMSTDLFMHVRQHPTLREIFRGQAGDLHTKLTLMVVHTLGRDALKELPPHRPSVITL